MKTTTLWKNEITTRWKNFYDQPIDDLINQYDEVRKVSAGQGDDYTTGCLFDFDYFKNSYRLIVADLSKEKALNGDWRAIQQIIFTGRANAGAMNNSENEFENAWWKWSASRIITDNKTKGEAEKYI